MKITFQPCGHVVDVPVGDFKRKSKRLCPVCAREPKKHERYEKPETIKNPFKKEAKKEFTKTDKIDGIITK